MKLSNFKPIGHIKYPSGIEQPTLVASVDVQTGFWFFKKHSYDVKIVRDQTDDEWYFLSNGKPAKDAVYLECRANTMLEAYNQPLAIGGVPVASSIFDI